MSDAMRRQIELLGADAYREWQARWYEMTADGVYGVELAKRLAGEDVLKAYGKRAGDEAT